MTNMKLEFPMLTIAEAMKYNYTSSGLSCTGFYEDYLGMDDDMSERLCTSSTNFTFSGAADDPMQTCVALTNTYLYNSDFNDWYYDEFMKVSELPDA